MSLRVPKGSAPATVPDPLPPPAGAAAAAAAEVIRLLLQNGADPLSVGPHGKSPIAMAANQGNFQVMDALLAARPDVATRLVAYQLPTTGEYEELGLLTGLALDLACTSVLSCPSGGLRGGGGGGVRRHPSSVHAAEGRVE